MGRVAQSTTFGAVYKSDSGVIIHAEGTVVLELYQCSWAWAERKGCFGLIDSKDFYVHAPFTLNYPIVKVNFVPVRNCSQVDAFDRDLVKSRPPNASWQRVRASRESRPPRSHSDDAASTLPDVGCRRHGCERLHTRQVSLLAPVAHPSPRRVVPVAASPIAPPSLRRRQRFKTTRA